MLKRQSAQCSYLPLVPMKNNRIIASLVLALSMSTFVHAQIQTAVVNMANTSAMVTLAPGGSATVGFVVGEFPQGQTNAWYIIRAVGPSLSQFGITNPAPQPVIRMFDSHGDSYPPVMGGIPIAYDPVRSFAQVGAFPLLKGALDAYLIVSIWSPGNYTVQVTDSSGKGGVVLIEVYASPLPAIAAE